MSHPKLTVDANIPQVARQVLFLVDASVKTRTTPSWCSSPVGMEMTTGTA